jgi:hypothetical protein
MQKTRVVTIVAAVVLVFGAPVRGEGQERRPLSAGGDVDSLVTVIPGAEYRVGGLGRAFLGSGWRDLWVTPVDVPILDIGRYAGGLKVDERGGGFHTITLHLTEEKGWREYRFRSVNKYPAQGMAPALRGTLVGKFLEDQTSTELPAAPLLVPPFLDAIGALHVKPELYRMRDDARLGVHRETFAGMLGTMELKGEEAPDDKPGFAGSSKIKGYEGFFEDLVKSRAHRLNEHEFLAVRLIDFLINDPDRTRDNFDWARFGEKGAYVWRPLARDRDRAFVDANGWVNALIVRPIYPKAVAFGPKYSLEGLTFGSVVLDRRLLQRLTREDFTRIALNVQKAITNDVIEEAIAAMPERWRKETEEPARLRSVLRARRNALPAITARFYEDLASEVDIHGTDEQERADIVRHADGTVTVTVVGRDETNTATTSNNGAAREPYFRRTFLPGETKEVRVYLGGESDHAVVRGAATDAIIVRVIGGKGDDVLADSAAGGGTHLYDFEGTDQFVRSSSTKVSRREWTPPAFPGGFRVGRAWRPDWGGSKGWNPVIDNASGAGIILGFGPKIRSYGFRRLPHHWEADAKLLVGTGNGRLALTADADYRKENSPLAFTMAARASQLDPLRFHGYGNNTAEASRHLSLVNQTVLAVEPALVRHIGWRAREHYASPLHGDTGKAKGFRPMQGQLEVGPTVSWIDPEPRANSPLATLPVPGRDAFGVAGARIGLELDRTDRDPIPTKGWRLEADVAAYPPVWDVNRTFTTSRAMGSAYLPLGSNGTHLAVRAGGSKASGDVPVQFAPTVGGWHTLRGYGWKRFTGDAAVDGSTELRVPVGTLNFLVRWDTGVFGLADVGRVWLDGSSPGGWHTGVGGGLWFSSLGRSFTVAYARGEGNRFYVKTDLF